MVTDRRKGAIQIIFSGFQGRADFRAARVRLH